MKAIWLLPCRRSQRETSSAFLLLLALLAAIAGLLPAEAMDIVVASAADSGNGTLRQAIQFNESLGGGNRIVFATAVTGTIVLTNPLGELVITRDVAILGPGARALAIDGTSAHRVFELTSNVNVSISGLTITHGSAPFGEYGGGIHQESGILALSDCAVSENYVNHGNGAGLSVAGTATATRCTFSSNVCYVGGGIYAGGTFSAVNCTVFGNYAKLEGGGIFHGYGGLFLTNCTISSNACAFDGYGGGINNAGGTVTVRNAIIAGNSATTDGPDCYGAFTSAGFNLVGAFNGSSGWGGLGDQLGTTNKPIDPVLGPLQDNGGSTPTTAPLRLYSPAIDQGNSAGVVTDQRGRPRAYTNSYVSSIPLGGDRSDIGAYEVSPITLLVTNSADSGPGSLRQAIASAVPNDVDTVRFASNVVGMITLTSGELILDRNMNIAGPGAQILAVSGNYSSRVFHVTNGDVLLAGLTITRGTNNVVPFSSAGGGILNDDAGRLVVSNCVLIGNSARYLGAGIANRGVLRMVNSTIASNSAFGGGAQSAGGAGFFNVNNAWIENCTISGNTASGGFAPAGGGVYNSSTDPFGLTVYYSTVTSNAVVNGGNLLGGGVFNPGGGSSVISLVDSIVANNTGGSSPDVGGSFPYAGFNLIGKVDGSAGLTNGVNFNLAGSSAAPLDPRLGPLRDNGGPTPTHALSPDSPALDRATSQFGTETDQRGAPRAVYLPSVPHPGVTDGSDIGAFELGVPSLEIQRSGAKVILSWPAYYGDVAAESVTNLPASGNWNGLAGTPAIVDNHFSVTNDASGQSRFYRLTIR